MDKNRILELLARKLAHEATQTELEELNELMAAFSDSVYYEEILNELWLQSENPFDKQPELNFSLNRHLLKFKDDFAPVEKDGTYNGIKKYKILIGLTAALFVIFSIGFIFFSKKDKSRPNIYIVASKGLRKKISLPDGTMVWLNADSKLSYNSNINQNSERIVYLTGEAFFDVAHHQSHPFIVRTNKLSIKVLGTAFNVKAYPEDKKSEATLIRGSIELSINDRNQQKILLNPTEKFALIDEKCLKTKDKNPDAKRNVTLIINHINPVRIGDRAYIEETSWKDSVLVFKNESFEELKPKLERWYNVEIHLNSIQPKSYRFTGILKDENIKEALTAMQLIKPFNFKLNQHDVIIY
jgi:transmembrane sensor